MDGLNLGYMWQAMCVLAYMAFVVEGNVVVAVYHMGGGDRRVRCLRSTAPVGLQSESLGSRGLKSLLAPDPLTLGRPCP